MIDIVESAVRSYLLASLLVLALNALAAEKDKAAEKQSAESAPAIESAPRARQSTRVNLTQPVYVPPRRGAPLTRVGGGTRGSHDQLPFVSVITPEHTGLVATPQPRLYWYLSTAIHTRFECGLVNDMEIEPIIEVTFDGGMQPGFNHIDLAEHGVTLQPGIAYQWSVALVQDPLQRSADIVSSGRIEYVAPRAALKEQLKVASPLQAVQLLAAAGYWYDTFALLSEAIAAKPENADFLEARAALLEQVGLAGLTAGGEVP